MSSTVRLRATLLATGSAGAAAVVAAHRPPAPAAAPGDPTSLVSAVAIWAAWALAIYLLGGMAAAAAGRLRRSDGGRVHRALTPAVVRRLVDVVVGATATAALALPPAAAFADTGHGPGPGLATSRVSASPLDWPGLRPVARTPTAGHAESVVVTVRPGDSLWSLTAAQLGPDADPAQIAARWPRVYAANRHVIGPDPALIHPGQRLSLPPTTGGAS